jgi:hypothetical protein
MPRLRSNAALALLAALVPLAAPVLAGAGGARGQTPAAPTPPTQNAPAQNAPAQPGGGPLAISPIAPPPPAAEQPKASLTLGAVFPGTGGDRAIRDGLIWRIYRLGPGDTPELFAKAEAAMPGFALPPGDYLVHAAYGLASATARVQVGEEPRTETLTIAAGGLVLNGRIGDVVIPGARISHRIYVPADGDLEGRLVAEDIPGGQTVRLPEGVYHVVSTFGDSNAVVRADLRVEAGKVTNATLRHRAATITLKLVAKPGGEAIADTVWSVLTPGGDVVREAVGAFPAMDLSEGEYAVVARNGPDVFTGSFTVEAGRDRDVEVLTTK